MGSALVESSSKRAKYTHMQVKVDAQAVLPGPLDAEEGEGAQTEAVSGRPRSKRRDLEMYAFRT
jgi:hypothetical protein